ncbi:MAG: D-alanyl-D-alanine carboxypeptidase/D-alanyl-D-alanine-endopeptidase [Pseudohongiella sp.]|nr:D-alanyl-D-alanine carboxypeptidase/D-alanyl-D-alanine-endopeptidase [Pseudohongiella sp.]
MALLSFCSSSVASNIRGVVLLAVGAVCAAFSAPHTIHAQNTVPPAVQVVINGHRLPENTYTLYVKEVGSESPLLAINEHLPLNPASTIKTLTTLAGLQLLGPTYNWTTEVYALGEISNGTLQGDLLIRGGGDPFLVEEHFRSLLKTLQRRGVNNITGDLIIDASLFHPSASQEPLIDNDSRRAYNVLPHALMVNFQTVNFYFYPHENGRDVIIKADPALPNLAINNQLSQRDAACSGFQRGISFDVDDAGNTVTFSGRFPSRCDEYVLTRSVLDAPAYAYGLFMQLWQELGGEFSGSLREQALPADPLRVPIVRHDSPPLADIIKSINKYSNNMMTRHLLLTLGLERSGAPATVENGIAAVRNYLDQHNIDHAQMVMVNGSGLSRDVRLTSNMLGAALERGYQIPVMPEYLASMPLSGLDGTMRTRLTQDGPAGSMHVKTGSLDNVAGVAGYVHARSGKHYVVIAILNHTAADAGPGQELADALLNWAWSQ